MNMSKMLFTLLIITCLFTILSQSKYSKKPKKAQLNESEAKLLACAHCMQNRVLKEYHKISIYMNTTEIPSLAIFKIIGRLMNYCLTYMDPKWAKQFLKEQSKKKDHAKYSCLDEYSDIYTYDLIHLLKEKKEILFSEKENSILRELFKKDTPLKEFFNEKAYKSKDK